VEKSTISALIIVGGTVLAGTFQALALRAVKRKRLKEQEAESDGRMREFQSSHGIEDADSD